MIRMNSVLTVEERYVLQSLDCKDKKQAIDILDEMKMLLPVRSKMFRIVLVLLQKLEHKPIDFAHEMETTSFDDYED